MTAAGPKHDCAAEGCTRRVPLKLLMCRPHWGALPAELRRAVWATYRRGQEIDLKLSPAYIAAVRDAIDWLKQNHPLDKRARS